MVRYRSLSGVAPAPCRRSRTAAAPVLRRHSRSGSVTGASPPQPQRSVNGASPPQRGNTGASPPQSPWGGSRGGPPVAGPQAFAGLLDGPCSSPASRKRAPPEGTSGSGHSQGLGRAQQLAQAQECEQRHTPRSSLRGFGGGTGGQHGHCLQEAAEKAAPWLALKEGTGKECFRDLPWASSMSKSGCNEIERQVSCSSSPQHAHFTPWLQEPATSFAESAMNAPCTSPLSSPKQLTRQQSEKEELLKKRGPMRASEYEAVPGDDIDDRVQYLASQLPRHLGDSLRLFRLSRGLYKIGGDKVHLAWQSMLNPPTAQCPNGAMVKEVFVSDFADGRGYDKYGAERESESLAFYLKHCANVAYELDAGSAMTKVPQSRRLSFIWEPGTLLRDADDPAAKLKAMSMAKEQAKKREEAAREWDKSTEGSLARMHSVPSLSIGETPNAFDFERPPIKGLDPPQLMIPPKNRTSCGFGTPLPLQLSGGMQDTAASPPLGSRIVSVDGVVSLHF